jgi:anion-transporting  ArsA/GET3 family ATPase
VSGVRAWSDDGSAVDALLGPGIVVLTGSDGVGKTTTSAAIAARAAALSGMRVVVLTIDPARRLASAMGLQKLGNRIREVDWKAAGGPGQPRGRLYAGMLETKSAWDELIIRQAGGREKAAPILANPYYREISGAFVGSHEYIAMERLYDLWESERYDLIVLDTPPSRNALDFLEAPHRMTELVGGGLLGLLARPGAVAGRIGMRMFSLAGRPVMALADRALGGSTLRELSEFLVSIEGMYEGFKRRAEGVLELLGAPSTRFLVVTTLEEVPFQEARFFVEKLREAGMHLEGAIVNKLLPASLLDDAATALARELSAGADPVLQALGHNYLDHRVLALRDRDMLGRIEELGVPLLGSVRRQDQPVGDLRGLLEVAAEIAGGAPG